MDGVAIDDLACSGDVSFARGHFHPNKPPGLSFVAVPAYFVISHFERLMHRNPDTWWLLNVNAWLTSVFSVGLISAAGVVLAFRIALRLGGGRTWPAFWTAIAFGFGTLFFPFATLLFDHDVTAIFLVAAFYLLFQRERARAGSLSRGCWRAWRRLPITSPRCRRRCWAFTCSRRAGAARAGPRPLRSALWYGAGAGRAAGGHLRVQSGLLRLAFRLEQRVSKSRLSSEKGLSFLGMFGVPDPAVALILLISPFRGIFYGAPILAMGVYGLWRMRRGLPRGDGAVHRHRRSRFSWSIAPSAAGTPVLPAGRVISSRRRLSSCCPACTGS